MPRYKFVVHKERVLASSSVCTSDTRTSRTGSRSGASKYRDLLVPSFSLDEDSTNTGSGSSSSSNSSNKNNSGTVNDSQTFYSSVSATTTHACDNQTFYSSVSTATQPYGVSSPNHGRHGRTGSAFSFSSYGSSTAYSTDNEEWVTKIDYHTRGDVEQGGYNPVSTTVVTNPPNEEEAPAVHDEKYLYQQRLLAITPRVTNGTGNVNDGLKADEIETDPVMLTAHMIYDTKMKDLALPASATMSTAAPSSDQSTRDGASSDYKVGTLLNQFGAFWVCSANDRKGGILDGEDVENDEYSLESRTRDTGHEITEDTSSIGTISTNTGHDVYDTRSYDDTGTYASTLEDELTLNYNGTGGMTTLATGSTGGFEDDSFTNETSTYIYEESQATHQTYHDNDSFGEEESRTTYSDIAGVSTLGDETSFTEDEDVDYHNAGVVVGEVPLGEVPHNSPSNEDSSYGSDSFRSPLSDSYLNPQKSGMPMGESRSRPGSHFREISLPGTESSNQTEQIPNDGAHVVEIDSLSYTKSRSLNRALINSFIEVKSTSSHSKSQQKQQQEEQPQKEKPKYQRRQEQKPKKEEEQITSTFAPAQIFTFAGVGDAEESTEKRDEPEAQPEAEAPEEPFWSFLSPTSAIAMEYLNQAKKQNQKTTTKTKSEDVSSKAVKITVTKTQKTTQVNTCGLENTWDAIPSATRRFRPSSPFRMAMYGRDDDDVDVDTRPFEVRDGPMPGTPMCDEGRDPSHKSSYRTAGPLLLVDTSPTFASQQDNKKSLADSDSVLFYDDDTGSTLRLRGNLTPIARLRNPISYDVLSLD